MTLFKGCFVVKCDEAGKPIDSGEVSVLYKVAEIASFSEYDPETQVATYKVFTLLETVR